ncbi:hypothetical protein JIN78_06350, partial [Roseibacillus ishigakijimensis]
LVVDLVRDHDGLISRSLFDYLWETGDPAPFQPALTEFAEFWKTHTIPNRKLALFNLAAQEYEPGKYRLQLIDGFLKKPVYSLVRLSHRYALGKSQRQIKDMYRYIDKALKAREENKLPGELGFLKSRT